MWDDPRRRSRILLAFAVAAVFGVLASHRLHDNDLYWHLANGRSVVESRAIVIPETLALDDFGPKVLAHQWPWDVLLYRVVARFGFVGVSWLVVAFAVVAGLALVALLCTWNERRPRSVVVAAVALVAAPLVLTRLNERPETSVAVLWPCGLMLARWLGRAVDARASAIRAGVLVAFAFAWAQVHLSVFAFVPAVVLILAPSAFGWGGAERARWMAAAGVAASTFATPYGLVSASVFTSFVKHPVGGYVSEHVQEWRALGWDMLDPTDAHNVAGPAYALLLLVAVFGAVKLRRRAFVEIGLAALGFAVVLKGRRGILPAAYLTAPMVLVTLERAFAREAMKDRVARAAAAAVGLFTVARMESWTVTNEGPLLRLGLEDGAFPLAAARWLATLEGEHRALTTYRSGPTIGYETRGRVRGYVDSRTPHYFTEANLAAARAAWQDPRALAVVTERHRLDLAVVERTFPVCTTLLAASKEWMPVIVEPAFTTFVRRSAFDRLEPHASLATIQRLSPCGSAYLDEARACAEPTSVLDVEIERSAAFVSPAFARQLRADARMRCAKGSFDGDAVAALIPRAAEASGFEGARDGLEAWLFALAGRPRDAVTLLAPHVDAGDDWVVADALGALGRGGADVELRRLLEQILENHRDRTPDAVVIQLANTCARLGDAECASVVGAKAAAVGRIEVAPALCYVRAAGTPEARIDAEAWLATFRRWAPTVSCEHPTK